MKRTSASSLVITAIAVGLVSHMLLAYLDDRSATPVPVSAVTTMLLLAIAVILWRLGIGVKRLVAKEETTMDAIGAARVALFAKSCSLGGAGLTGYFGAQTMIGARNFSSPLYFEHTWIAGASVLACLALVIVAMIVESWCVIPPDDDDPSGGARSPSAA
ncbi:hypothetical protein BSZ39_05555 [Bowdeniella nasicola]|uniref:DUF3180 domain-containing protein n=1 Tax=Bowdeniella nasicola TaxID=208480 RepID=A0A1Q5Q2Z5_9ACTO|nr:DUF3180 domain-containing protein [Bowdeniella nasicola]OKL54186.1 hypothetical protein BSZ39_05555 [Bowdeniella nasicola]